jgi:hypothetical protein
VEAGAEEVERECGASKNIAGFKQVPHDASFTIGLSL